MQVFDITTPEDFEKESGLMWKKNFPKTNTSNSKRKPYKKYLGYIAVAFIVLMVVLGKLWVFSSDMDVHQTMAGEIKSITLSDGTFIDLNVYSTLKVSKDFNEKTRTVFLDGEAYFNVVKDSLHPFIIITKASQTTVLGTKFNFSAYKEEPEILTLNEGKVQFSSTTPINDARNSIIIRAYEQATLNHKGITKKSVNPDLYKAWVHKDLVFKNQNFLLVINDIERFYGIKIIVKKKGLNNREFSASYKNPPLDLLIEDLSIIFKFKYKKEKDTLIIF